VARNIIVGNHTLAPLHIAVTGTSMKLVAKSLAAYSTPKDRPSQNRDRAGHTCSGSAINVFHRIRWATGTVRGFKTASTRSRG
jgi:hypothetical protein